MAEEVPFKVLIEGDLLGKVKGVFERQGVSHKEGCARLFRWFTSQSELAQAVVLDQLHGENGREVSRRVSADLGKPGKKPGRK